LKSRYQEISNNATLKLVVKMTLYIQNTIMWIDIPAVQHILGKYL